MKAVFIKEFGSAKNLEIREVENPPKPVAKQVLVNVKTSALNRADILQHFVKLPQGTYEQLEGLEQLRFLENGVKVQTVEVSGENGPLQSGIDSPEDLARAEAHIRQFGDDLP